MTQWAFITGYPDYAVSDAGEVLNITTGVTLTPCDAPSGSLAVFLFEGPQIKKTHLIHRLVAEAFLPDYENYLVVKHVDGDKHNNHYRNLYIPGVIAYYSRGTMLAC